MAVIRVLADTGKSLVTCEVPSRRKRSKFRCANRSKLCKSPGPGFGDLKGTVSRRIPADCREDEAPALRPRYHKGVYAVAETREKWGEQNIHRNRAFVRVCSDD